MSTPRRPAIDKYRANTSRNRGLEVALNAFAAPEFLPDGMLPEAEQALIAAEGGVIAPVKKPKGSFARFMSSGGTFHSTCTERDRERDRRMTASNPFWGLSTGKSPLFHEIFLPKMKKLSFTPLQKPPFWCIIGCNCMRTTLFEGV